MILHNNINALQEDAKGCLLVIGNFDGIHLGHQAVVKEARAIANELKVPLGIMTFDPHPKQFFINSLDDFCLISQSAKKKLFAEMEVDHLFIVDFDKDFSKISSEEFINRVLQKQLQVKHVLIGEGFVFGYERSGNVNTLKQAEKDGKFGLTVLAIKKLNEDTVYSSTVIRELLRSGKFDDAEKLLGRKWQIESPVVHGDKRGRELGFPTANQRIDDYVKIPYGVYAVKVLIDGESVWREGVANFGIRPMFEVKTPIFETFIFDFDSDIYDKNLTVVPIEHLRPEMKFKNTDILVSKIKDDCIKAKAVLKYAKI